mmetsp:Transcript_4292/g.12396  ORF Transcript_4292/g.12396 Transcript_4292/m.12396 type:complete len:207 (-) Transcript_4292:227-847(-)
MEVPGPVKGGFGGDRRRERPGQRRRVGSMRRGGPAGRPAVCQCRRDAARRRRGGRRGVPVHLGEGRRRSLRGADAGRLGVVSGEAGQVGKVPASLGGRDHDVEHSFDRRPSSLSIRRRVEDGAEARNRPRGCVGGAVVPVGRSGALVRESPLRLASGAGLRAFYDRPPRFVVTLLCRQRVADVAGSWRLLHSQCDAWEPRQPGGRP